MRISEVIDLMSRIVDTYNEFEDEKARARARLMDIRDTLTLRKLNLRKGENEMKAGTIIGIIIGALVVIAAAAAAAYVYFKGNPFCKKEEEEELYDDFCAGDEEDKTEEPEKEAEEEKEE